MLNHGCLSGCIACRIGFPPRVLAGAKVQRGGHLGRNRHSVFALKDRPQSGRAVAAAHGCPGRPLFNGSMSATRGPEWKPGDVYSLGMSCKESLLPRSLVLSVPCLCCAAAKPLIMLCSELGTARDEGMRGWWTRRRMWIADGVTGIDEESDSEAIQVQGTFYV